MSSVSCKKTLAILTLQFVTYKVGWLFLSLSLFLIGSSGLAVLERLFAKRTLLLDWDTLKLQSTKHTFETSHWLQVNTVDSAVYSQLTNKFCHLNSDLVKIGNQTFQAKHSSQAFRKAEIWVSKKVFAIWQVKSFKKLKKLKFWKPKTKHHRLPNAKLLNSPTRWQPPVLIKM